VHDITERKQAEETQRLLNDELNHRVKNTMATVQAMAEQTLLRRAIRPISSTASAGGCRPYRTPTTC
jgi:two-component sensor histidine kinase